MVLGCLERENVFLFLAAAGDWVKKGSYHTTAIGPRTGGRCWPLPAGLWSAVAPLMKPSCAEGDVPTAANLNLCGGWKSRIGWHSDDEPLFGERWESRLVVWVSFGFKWKGKSCPDGEASLCCLGHVATSFFTVRIRHFVSISAVCTSRKLVGRSHGVLLLSSKCARPSSR